MKSRMRAALAALFFLALLSPAQAQDDNSAALHEQADAGDAKAQFALANHYFRGRGVSQDYVQALILYRRSADQGFAAAQNQLGNMYEHGFGVSQDFGRGMTYYRQAADHPPKTRDCVAKRFSCWSAPTASAYRPSCRI